MRSLILILSFLLFIMGLAGLPEDIVIWEKWLRLDKWPWWSQAPVLLGALLLGILSVVEKWPQKLWAWAKGDRFRQAAREEEFSQEFREEMERKRFERRSELINKLLDKLPMLLLFLIFAFALIGIPVLVVLF